MSLIRFLRGAAGRTPAACADSFGRRKKPLALLLLALSLCLSITACGKPSAPSEPAQPPEAATQWDEASGTMTLTDAALTQPLTFARDATVVLCGSNTITISADTSEAAYGIEAAKALRLTGSGTLRVEIRNALGNATAIKADELTVALDAGGSIALDARAEERSGRGVYTTGNCSFTSGSLTASAMSGGAGEAAFCVYSYQGDIAVDKAFTLACSGESTQGEAHGVQADVGTLRVDGAVEAAGRSNAGTVGLLASQQILIGETASIHMQLSADADMVTGLSCTQGEVQVSGSVRLELNGGATVGGFWAYTTASFHAAAVELSAVSTAAGEGDSAYGVVSNEGISVTDGSLNLSVTGDAATAYGLYSGGAIAVTGGTAEIAAKSAGSSCGIRASEYSFGDGLTSPSVLLDGCAATITAGTAAISSDGAQTIQNAAITEGAADAARVVVAPK